MAAHSGTAEDVALSFAIASIALTALDYQFILWRLGRPSALVRLACGPIPAAAITMVIVNSISFADHWPLLLRLPTEAAIALLAYLILLGLIWWLRGRPVGAEQTLTANAQALVNRIRERLR